MAIAQWSATYGYVMQDAACVLRAKPVYGLYFLMIEEVLVYVGKSNNILRRLGEHSEKFQSGEIGGTGWDSVLIIDVAQRFNGSRKRVETLEQLETEAISDLRPIWNIRWKKV